MHFVFDRADKVKHLQALTREKMKKARTAHPSSLSCALLTSPGLKMKCKSELFGAPVKCALSICMCGWWWDRSKENIRSKSNWNLTLPSYE